MAAYNIELSKEVKEIAKLIPLKEDYLKGLIGEMLSKSDELGYNIGGEIVVGMDVNGPIVKCGDNSLAPFPGAIECINHLMNTDGIQAGLMTGWDLSTMTYFKQNKLKLPTLGIVGEYGMVFERAGNVRFLYPYREEERLGFLQAVFKVANEMDVKVAFQGNYSPGAGAICVEGDEHGDLLEHPLVKGRRPTIGQLYNAIKEKSNAELNEKEEKIVFENKIENLKGFAEALFKTHPMISVRVKDEGGSKLSIRIDPKDKPDFDFEKIKEFATAAEKYIGRKSMPYEDHGVDFFAEEVTAGKYSKDTGLREFGRDGFGNDLFISAIIGDKNTDIPVSTKNTIMFPLKGSEAEMISKEKNIPHVSAIDVRDFALALSEAHRIKKGI